MRIRDILIFITLVGCVNNSTDSKVNQDDSYDNWNKLYTEHEYKSFSESCNLFYFTDSFNNIVFPFDFTGFNSQKLRQYFKHDIQVDSIEREDSPGYPYYYFRFSDSLSQIDFFVKSFEEQQDFFIDRSIITTNIFAFKNGISIGDSKEDFLDKMKLEILDCDSIRFSVGELSTDFDFIFKDNVLKKILVWPSS